MQNFLAGSCGSFSTGSNKFHYSISAIPWLSVLTLQETVSFQRVRYGFKPICVEGGGHGQRGRKSYMCIIRMLPAKRWHLKPICQVGQTGFNRDGLRFSMRFLTKPSTSHCRFAHGLRSLPAGRTPPLQQQDRWPEFPPATRSSWYEKRNTKQRSNRSNKTQPSPGKEREPASWRFNSSSWAPGCLLWGESTL